MEKVYDITYKIDRETHTVRVTGYMLEHKSREVIHYQRMYSRETVSLLNRMGISLEEDFTLWCRNQYYGGSC